MKHTKTKHGIWDGGAVRPASKRYFAGAIRLTLRKPEEVRLGLHWYAPDQIKA